MAQQTGRTLLIKKGDGASPEVFTTVCGFLARSFTINNNLVDVSVPDCITPDNPVVQTMVYGVQALGFNGTGLFDNDAVGKAVANAARSQTTSNYQIIVPGWGTFQGAFIVETFNFSGDRDGNMEFEATFRANGTITFTAV